MQFERPEPRAENINVRLRTKERERAEKAAAAAGVTVSELVRAGLRHATSEVLGERQSGGEAT